MKMGDSILVLDGPWKSGVFIAHNEDGTLRVGIGKPNHYNYRITDRQPSDVKRFISLAESAAASFHEAESPKLFAMIKEAGEKLLPTVSIKLVEGSIVALDGAVTCDPVVFNQVRIGAVEEVAGWQVNLWKHYPATRYEPENVSESPQGLPSRNLYSLAQNFLNSVFKVISAEYWEAKNLEDFADSFEMEKI